MFSKDGKAKVITAKQKLNEMIASGKVKVWRSASIQSRLTSWLRRLRNVREDYGIEQDDTIALGPDEIANAQADRK